MKSVIRSCLIVACLAMAVPAAASTDPGVLLQLADYVGVDYPEAVADGKVINPAEYAEMQEFAQRVAEAIDGLPDGEARAELAALAARLVQLVQDKDAPAAVAETTRSIRNLVMQSYPVVTMPRVRPNLERAAQRYQAACAACHGSEGYGDGPAAAGLEPPPTDFHDAARGRQRSLYGLYNTITLGVSGTSMAGFSQLSDEERWALAFYVGGLYADAATLTAGSEAARQGKRLSLQDVVTRAPAELSKDEAAIAVWLRQSPAPLFAGRADPIETALARLAQSAEAYAAGDRQRAGSLAISAYLDGFELAEAGLANVDARLVTQVEEAMIGYRAAVSRNAPVDAVRARADEIALLLGKAQRTLHNANLTPSLAFLSALVILLREGLEAILVLAAVMAFLVRTGRREAMPYLHSGWIGALALGGLTWVAATWVVDISGAVREVTEGITALVAAGILFYVGFWMHDKMHADRWQRFLEDKVKGALDARRLWGIAFIAFVAVYREAFETILFYQALWAQVDASAHASVFMGAGAAALALGALTWAILRFGLRLPLKQFFAASAAVMLLLAVVFAGNGIAALQEAGKISISPVPFPRIDLLGIYPTWQTLAAQLALVLAGAALLLYGRHRPAPRPRMESP